MLLGGTGGGGGSGGGATFIQYDATQEIAYTNGQSIPQLLDFSGGARHTTGRGGAGTLPTWESAGFGVGKPAIRFAGNSWFSLPSVSALTEGEQFVVIKVDSDPAASAALSISWRFGPNPTSCYPYTDGHIYDEFGNTVQRDCGNPGPVLTTARLYNSISTPTEWTANLDTTQIFTTATNTVAWNATPLLGGEVTGGFIHLGIAGYIAEYRLYPTKRTSPQRAFIEAELKVKHGLTGY